MIEAAMSFPADGPVTIASGSFEVISNTTLRDVDGRRLEIPRAVADAVVVTVLVDELLAADAAPGSSFAPSGPVDFFAPRMSTITVAVVNVSDEPIEFRATLWCTMEAP